LVIRPQSLAAVMATRRTLVWAPPASVVGLKTRLPSLIDQPADAGLIDQGSPDVRVACRISARIYGCPRRRRAKKLVRTGAEGLAAS
jgi:hypothetical protein